MKNILSLFPTLIYSRKLKLSSLLIKRALKDIKELQRKDALGKEWSQEKYFSGYTSYGSISDLPHRYPSFRELQGLIDEEKNAYVKALKWKVSPKDIRMSSCWANVMGPGCHHSFHIHPMSVISGTVFLKTPRGSGLFKIQDPRMPLFMARPLAKESSEHQPFFEITPEPGLLVLFESWLPHEVPANRSQEERMSVSFNYELSEA